MKRIHPLIACLLVISGTLLYTGCGNQDVKSSSEKSPSESSKVDESKADDTLPENSTADNRTPDQDVTEKNPTSNQDKEESETTQMENKINIVAAASKSIEYEQINNGLVSMEIPKGWKFAVHPSSDYVHYTFQVVNPENTDYQILFAMKNEGFLASEKERQWYASLYPTAPMATLPAIDPQTAEAFFRVYNQSVSASGGNIAGDFAYPVINDFSVTEKMGTQPLVGGDILRATYKNANGKAVDGIFTASPAVVSLYYVNAVNVYNIMFITAPAEEFINWEPILNHCVSTISFSDAFSQGFMSQENAIFTSSQQIAQMGRETSDIITKGWEARQSSYDIISQKQSDATLGYERVYDTETGEIYKAYNGFTDDYKSEKYKPISDDMYLSAIDGYIEK